MTIDQARDRIESLIGKHYPDPVPQELLSEIDRVLQELHNEAEDLGWDRGYKEHVRDIASA